MKICSKCSAHNSDERIFCIDCDERLGDKLSANEEAILNYNTNIDIEKMYDKNDPLCVNIFHKVMGIASFIGAICSFLIIILFLLLGKNFGYLWVSILLFMLAGIEALVPKFMWTLEQMRLSFFIRDAQESEPSSFYLTSRNISIIFSVAIGLLFVILTILGYGKI